MLAPAARTVGLRDDSFHGYAGLGSETPERGNGKFWRATKDDAHRGHPRGSNISAGLHASLEEFSVNARPTPVLPLAGLPQFANAAFDQVSLEHAEVLDEQDSVQVVDLMTERAREQSFAAHLI